MTAPDFFSAGWAEAVRDAVDRGPAGEVRATKLDDYWDWVDRAREDYGESWALCVRDLPTPGGRSSAYLLLTWSSGRCADGRIVEVGELPQATYVLAGDYADWVDLLSGYDPGRMVMYRRIVLERGPVLPFFRLIYFVIESLGCLARVRAALPVKDAASR